MARSVDGKSGKDVRIYENVDDLKCHFAEYVAEVSENSIKERGIFTIALSGGSLVTLMGKLSEAPYKKTVQWSKWYVLWSDERVVPRSHSDSNYRSMKDCFLSKLPIFHSRMHAINDNVTAEQAASGYEYVIRRLVRARVIDVSEINDCPRFDLILLGMGADGHIASLFPEHLALNEKEQWVTFLTDSPKPPPERITFTLPVINSAANVALVATGSSKAEAAHLAIDDIAPDSPVLPARMVQPVNGKVVWFLDMEAASKLEGGKSSEG